MCRGRARPRCCSSERGAVHEDRQRGPTHCAHRSPPWPRRLVARVADPAGPNTPRRSFIDPSSSPSPYWSWPSRSGADLRRRRREHADRHRRAWLHDHDEQEDREVRHLRDHNPRPLVHPQLPPDRDRHQQEDERPRTGNDELDGEAEEGHLPASCATRTSRSCTGSFKSLVEARAADVTDHRRIGRSTMSSKLTLMTSRSDLRRRLGGHRVRRGGGPARRWGTASKIARPAFHGYYDGHKVTYLSTGRVEQGGNRRRCTSTTRRASAE